MQYGHYLTPSIWDIVSHALLGTVIGSAFLLLWFGITALASRSTVERKVVIQCTALFAALGTWIGLYFGFNCKDDDNDRILQSNISQKYDAVITDMGIAPQTRGSHYEPTHKEPHEVKILVKGKEQLAILVQDKTTNEPTFLDYNTYEPLTDNLKAKPSSS